MNELIQIYSKDNCPQCLQAESLLKMKKREYIVLKLDHHYTREGLEKIVAELGKPAPRSFPVIIKGDFVGDLNALKMAIAKGTL